MSDFETWAYRGLIGVALAIIWYFLDRLLSELKDMNINIKAIGEKGIVHDGKLELVDTEVKLQEKTLNDHTTRLREVERKQDSCQVCREAK